MTQSQILVLAFWFLIIYRECTLLPALAESCSVADSKGLRILTTFFIMFLSLSVILFFSVWRVTSYQGDKDLKKRLFDNLRRRTDSMEDFENYTVATLLDNRYKNHFFQDREKRGCFRFHLLATLLTTLMCLSVFIHSKTLQIRGLSLKFTGF